MKLYFELVGAVSHRIGDFSLFSFELTFPIIQKTEFCFAIKTDYGGVFFFPFVYLSVLLLPPFQWFYGPFGSGIGSPKQRYRNIFTYVLANVTGRNLLRQNTF